MRSLLTVLSLLVATTATAQSERDEGGKFRVEGSVLVYDTEAAAKSEDREIFTSDVSDMLDILRKTEGLQTVKLNSTGGSIWAGEEMARMVMDFDMDTIVDGECSSACALIFLGGTNRTLVRGGKIGFHLRSWNSGSIRSYYEAWRSDEGWDTPYDFAAWLYQDVQSEVHDELAFMIERGVDARFAIETKRLRSEMWFPSRAELLGAGVVTQ